MGGSLGLAIAPYEGVEFGRVMLDFEEVQVEVGSELATVLVVTPLEKVVGGRERLRDSNYDRLGELDRIILENVRERAGRISGYVFRGRHPRGEGCWGFEDGLSAEERTEIAFRMFHAHLKLNRLMVRLGVTTHIYIDWADEELKAFQSGTDRLAGVLREQGPLRPLPDTPQAARQRLDLWICSNFTFYDALPLGVAVRSVLPMRLSRMREQDKRLSAMCDLVDSRVFEL